MTRPTVLFAAALFLLVGAVCSHAQGIDATKAAEQEAVRRQAQTETLRENLNRAADLDKRNDLNGAALVYEQCLGIVKDLGGVGVQPEYNRAIAGLTSVRLRLAKAANQRYDFPEADRQMDALLKVDPKNAAAFEFKRYNNEVAEAAKGRLPSPETLAKIPEVQNTKITVGTMVQDGKLLFEMRKLDDAEAKLREAIRLDPDNKAAYYYMNLIQEARYGDEARKRDNVQKSRLVDVEKAWNPPVQREILPSPNFYIRTNMVNTSSRSRQLIMAKLDKMMLKEVFFDGLPLSEVVRFLSEESKKQDPNKKGINFLINPNLDDEPSSRSAPAAGPGGPGDTGTPAPVDPLGLPVAAAPRAPAQKVDLEGMIIKINPPLQDVRMIDALDAICKVAEPIAGRGLKYIIEDYAVVFSQKNVDPPQMFTRTFKVDPNTFMQGLQSVSGIDLTQLDVSSGGGGTANGGGGGGNRGGNQGGQGGQNGQNGQNGGSVTVIPRVAVSGAAGGIGGAGGAGGQAGGQGGQGGQVGGAGIVGVTTTNLTENANSLVRQFFVAAGVNLSSNGVSSTQVFFNDRTGVLMVRASMQDLEIIQQAIEVLNIAPPQLMIEAKFAEVTQQDDKGLGFDWYLGATQLGGGQLVGEGGTQPSLTGPLNDPSNPNSGNKNFPGTPGFPSTLISPSSTDGFLTQGLRQQVGIGSQQAQLPTLGTLTGILTDPQFRMVIRAIEQRLGADLLSAPKVTTLSGRQTSVAVQDLVTIVGSPNVQQTGSGGGGALAAGGGTGAIGTTVSYPTTAVPFGTSLDVVPYVSADGVSIQMTILPTITEFIGYDNPGNFIPQAQSVGGSTVGVPLTAQLPLPRIRSRVVVTSCVVWDGQTIMLGGLITEDVRNVKDKVPVLGDVPLIGRLFRSESKSTVKKNLLIFVTPTIIDPAGNRVHSDEELPFAQNAVPPQVPWVVRDRNYGPQ